jgi:hypothetical protein
MSRTAIPARFTIALAAYSLLAASCPAAHASPPASAGHWLLDAPGGQAVIDTSGQGAEGTLGNSAGPEGEDPLRWPALFAAGLDFDGVDDLVRIPMTDSLALAAVPFTLQAWVAPRRLDVAQELIGSKWDTGFDGYRLRLSYQALGLDIGDGGQTLSHRSISNVTQPNRWRHVAATADGETVRLFVDGCERERFPSTALAAAPSGDLFLGRYPGNAYHLDGMLDESSVLRRALAPAELLRGHALAAEWWFDVGAPAQRVNDRSGRGHHAILGAVPGADPQDPTWVADAWGGALLFDGSDDRIGVPFHADLLPSGGLTLELWLQPGVLALGRESALLSFRDPIGGTPWSGCSLAITPGGGLLWEVADGMKSVELKAPAASLAAGVWQHLAATIGNAHMELWVDGRRVAVRSTSLLPLPPAAPAELRIGEAGVGAASFAGRLRSLRISALAQPPARLAAAATARGQWRFEEGGADPVIHDQWDSELDLQRGSAAGLDPADPLTTLGWAGSGLRFDAAVPSRAESSRDTPAIELGSHLTLEAWIKPDDVDAAHEIINHKWDSGDDGYRLRQIWSALRFDIGDGTTTYSVSSPQGILSAGRWQHVAATYDSAQVRLYVDGVEVHAAPLAAPIAPLSGRPLVIGAYQSDPAYGFAGVIDEVAIHRRPLTAVEIAARAGVGSREEHPRLFTFAADRDTLLARATQPIYDSFFASILSSADAALTHDLSDPTLVEHDRATYTRCVATAAWISDSPERELYLDHARQGLTHAGDGPVDWEWHHGTIGRDYALAYDAVAALLNAEEDRDARQRLARFASGFLQGFRAVDSAGDSVEYGGLYSYSASRDVVNGRMRPLGGLGLLALAMPDYQHPVYGRASDWLDFVLRDLWEEHGLDGYARGHTVGSVVSADGPYKEGSSYLNDSFGTITPFLLALAHLDSTDTYTDFTLANPLLQGMYRWSIDRRRADGKTPTTDTGWLSTVPMHELVAPFMQDPGLHYWFWEEQSPSLWGSFSWIDLALFDRSAYLALTHPPSYNSVASGTTEANLRTGWQESDTHLLLLAEHDPDRSSHEQEDQGSITLEARGAALLIDPGDGRSYRHLLGEPEREWWMRDYTGHNVVLLDGVGPQVIWEFDTLRDPAQLTAFLTSPDVDLATSNTSYDDLNAEVRRSVILSGKLERRERIWVIDRMVAAADHQVAARFHLGDLYADADAGSLTMTAAGDLSWEMTAPATGNRVRLRIYTLTAPDSTMIYADGATEYRLAETFDHHYIDIFPPSGATTNATLFIPRETTEIQPEPQRLAAVGGDAMVVSDTTQAGLLEEELLLVASGGSLWSEVAQRLATDAAAATVASMEDTITVAAMIEGRALWLPPTPGADPEPLLSSSRSLSALLNLSPGLSLLGSGDSLICHFDPGPSAPLYSVSLHGLGNLPSSATWNGAPIPLHMEPGRVVISDLSGAGKLCLYLGRRGHLGRRRFVPRDARGVDASR